MSSTEQEINYTMGYSPSIVSVHASRTIYSDAAFVLPHISETDRILDVGCGPGTITVGFASLVPDGEVVGVDISDQILQQARANARAGRAENVSFRQGDVVKGLDEIPDASFDVVFASQVFPHLPTSESRTRAMAEMRRVLKSGGLLATRTFVDLQWYPRALGLDELVTKRMIRGFGTDEFGGAQMPALYRAAGFKKVTVGAGTTVWSTPEERTWMANNSIGRLAEGDTFRESWLAAGVTENDIEDTKQALRKWAETEDAWYIGVQADVLGWK